MSIVVTLLLVVVVRHVLLQTIRRHPRAGTIAAWGFVVRAVAGVVLFWISWLELPVGRSLQAGRGFWFFALDGIQYLDQARTLSAGGPHAILFAPVVSTAPLFVRTLACTGMLIGNSVGSALLLNLLSYVAVCTLIIRLGSDERRRSAAMMGLAFSPSFVLWCLQPLKEVVCILILAGFLTVARSWEQAIESGRAVRGLAVLVLMLLLLIALFDTRSALGLVVGSLMPCYLLLTLVRARMWRAVLAIPCALVIGLLVVDLLGVEAASRLPAPAELFSFMTSKREEYESIGGRTMIETTGSAGDAVPASMQKLVAGTVAALLPHSVARWLGVTIGVPRSGFLLVLTDVDTLFLDFFLLLMLGDLLRTRFRWTSLSALVAATSLLFGAITFYVVANFGTLVRMRTSVFVLLIILYLLLSERSAIAASTTITPLKGSTTEIVSAEPSRAMPTDSRSSSRSSPASNRRDSGSEVRRARMIRSPFETASIPVCVRPPSE